MIKMETLRVKNHKKSNYINDNNNNNNNNNNIKGYL